MDACLPHNEPRGQRFSLILILFSSPSHSPLFFYDSSVNSREFILSQWKGGEWAVNRSKKVTTSSFPHLSSCTAANQAITVKSEEGKRMTQDIWRKHPFWKYWFSSKGAEMLQLANITELKRIPVFLKWKNTASRFFSLYVYEMGQQDFTYKGGAGGWVKKIHTPAFFHTATAKL